MSTSEDIARSHDDSCYHGWLLSNGRFTTLLSADGGGFSAFDGLALTRWVPDPARDADGVHIYVRDLSSGACWTAGGGPLPAPGGHRFRSPGGSVELSSTVNGVECMLTVCVPPHNDVELRRVTLRNTTSAPVTLEVTTYAELSLNLVAADAAHPAFSKLFVQTAHDPARDALLAWRRKRSPEDRPLWAAHRLLVEDAPHAATFETDRARFIGRGRSLHDAAALMCADPLGGTVGNVLDPIFSTRRVITIEPGATGTVVMVLAAAVTHDLVLHELDAFPHVAAAHDAFAAAAPAPHDGLSSLGLPQRWSELLLVREDATSVVRPHPIHQDRASAMHVTAATVSAAPTRAPTAHQSMDDLLFFNGWGGFAADGASYVIRMPDDGDRPRRPPLPWVNVMANEDAGCIVSESGATYTWTANSRENRLTPWFNDPVSDPHGEALYIRDDITREVWSPTPGPTPARGGYDVRHGFGFTQFRHESDDLVHDTVVFVAEDAPARIARVTLTNRSAATRRLTVSGYAQLVLGAHEAETRGRVSTWRSHETGALMARNGQRGEFSERVAFAAAIGSDATRSWTTDRRAFLGDRGRTDSPAGVHADRLDGWTGDSRDPCFAESCTILLEPGATASCSFVLGEAASEAEAESVVRTLSSDAAIEAALGAVRRAWERRVGTVRIETPSPALDIMVNGWLVYQNLSCRMWARSAFYQSGGAFGFRDQLQDSSALLYLDPAITRRQILLHAAHQFVEGDVLHWWHPPTGKGIRTRFSDDLLWLPYITAFYIGRTGDRAILDEHVRYLTAPLLEEGEDELFLVPEESGTSGTLYEHCCRTIDRSMAVGTHGLPLMGVGDWNDGMNRVGRGGRGESVWLGFFICDILRDFIPLCSARNDHDRAARYRDHRERLVAALTDAGWDGEWYRRAFYDDGVAIGSAESDECRIDALAQAWAVISGVAPPDRAASALDAMDAQLVDEEAGLIRLLTPPFDRTPGDPGYIKGYLPGVRENGGQYTHGVLWAVRALAIAGRNDRAARLLTMLSPVTRGAAPTDAARYRVEPYVIAADVYGVEPHVGRGGWTWYTGSAGWMYRIAIESILGVHMHAGSELRLEPCIPDEWPGFNATLRFPDGTEYGIEVVRGAERRITIDGEAGTVSGSVMSVPLARDGRRHQVSVRLPVGKA